MSNNIITPRALGYSARIPFRFASNIAPAQLLTLSKDFAQTQLDFDPESIKTTTDERAPLFILSANDRSGQNSRNLKIHIQKPQSHLQGSEVRGTFINNGYGMGQYLGALNSSMKHAFIDAIKTKLGALRPYDIEDRTKTRALDNALIGATYFTLSFKTSLTPEQIKTIASKFAQTQFGRHKIVNTEPDDMTHEEAYDYRQNHLTMFVPAQNFDESGDTLFHIHARSQAQGDCTNVSVDFRRSAGRVIARNTKASAEAQTEFLKAFEQFELDRLF